MMPSNVRFIRLQKVLDKCILFYCVYSHNIQLILCQRWERIYGASLELFKERNKRLRIVLK